MLSLCRGATAEDLLAATSCLAMVADVRQQQMRDEV